MLEKNPETVQIVFKHFPLGNHRFAPYASIASIAAQKQGKFWQYHDLIYENYKDLSNEIFLEFAKKLELNIPQFENQMNSQESRDKVGRDFMAGREAGVESTPTLFINGRQVRERTLENIQKIINEELK